MSSTRNALFVAITTAFVAMLPTRAHAQFAVIDAANLSQNYLNGAQEVLTAAQLVLPLRLATAPVGWEQRPQPMALPVQPFLAP